MLARLFVTFGVGLYATRVLVNLLGYSDFGLLAAMGATGVLVMFVGQSLNMSGQRALAHESGREELERPVEVFNSTLAIFLVAGVALASALSISLVPTFLESLRTIRRERQRSQPAEFSVTD